MRLSKNSLLALATVTLGVLLLPWAAVAQSSANCPAEPTTNVPIALGEVFFGSNCTLSTDGDIDSFTFAGTSGDTYELATGVNGGSNNICLTIYDPNLKKVFGPTCTSIGFPNYVYSVVEYLTAATTGTYTAEVTEPANGKQSYAVSLQQDWPFAPYATQVPKWEDALPVNVSPLTDTVFFTFPSATTGTYQVKATYSSGANLCMGVTLADKSSGGSGCTSVGFPNYVNSVSVQFNPSKTQVGINSVSLQAAGNDSTSTGTLEISCVVGNCPEPVLLPPAPALCSLSDTPSYNATSSTLTLKFSVRNEQTATATWNAWLTDQSSNVTSIASESLTNTKTQTITETVPGLSTEGVVGVLSTITTATQGIVCSSWALINPVPTISGFSPSSATAGTQNEIALTINGTNFVPKSTVTYNGVAHSASYVSSTELKIVLTESDVATAGNYPVVVTNPTPAGGKSNSMNFDVKK